MRQKRTPEAVPELALAARLSPDDSNFAYVYAVGLYTTGQRDAALTVLNKARARFPANAEISSALHASCAEQSSSVCSDLAPNKLDSRTNCHFSIWSVMKIYFRNDCVATTSDNRQ